jgi:hypothetical protein
VTRQIALTDPRIRAAVMEASRIVSPIVSRVEARAARSVRY